MSEIFYIKVRETGAKRWAFLSDRGVNYLKVHAVRFPSRERADALIEANRWDNPGWEWKVVVA